jgi:ribosome-associated toxin RatA of RatAB toxin-antitoxin module
MTVFAESRIIAASIEEVFDLVADVESYPTFLPLWRDARIYERSGNVYYAGPVCRVARHLVGCGRSPKQEKGRAGVDM